VMRLALGSEEIELEQGHVSWNLADFNKVTAWSILR
jgi:hypothetical protein